MPKREVGRSMSLTSQESYSAVIIADMVAEVPTEQSQDVHNSDAVRRSSSTRSHVYHRKGPQTNIKEETNLGYDGHQTDSSDPPAVVDVEAMETVAVGKSNGMDISKGVILNAQLDHKLGSDFLNGSSKAIELKSSVSTPDGKDTKTFSTDFKDMSVMRRIAFVGSFLPSIMFVLCFAVILPCEKKMPCVEEIWTTTLNNTDITSKLRISDNIVFTYSQLGTYGWQGINHSTGITTWDDTFPSKPRFVDCGNLITSDSQACIVSDSTGAVHYYNAKTGDQLLRWDPTRGVSGAPKPSLPVLLPDCDGDGVAEVAVAVSPSHIKINFKGFSVSTIELPRQCDRMPEKLTSWTATGVNELVFVCRNGTNERLERIPLGKWCRNTKTKNEIVTLDTRSAGVLSNSHIVPAGNGIVIWSEDSVAMVDLDGKKRWTASTLDHIGENRFILYGKFNKADFQVALFSSDVRTNLQVTTLSFEAGEVIWNQSIANAEIGDVSLIQGSEKDFVLVVKRKVESDLAKQAVMHLNEVTTSIINLLSEEEVKVQTLNVTGSTPVVEEVSLMELNGDFTYTIDERKTTVSEGEASKTLVAVIPQETKEKNMKIISLRKQKSSSQFKQINVANWDISLSQNKQCISGTFK